MRAALVTSILFAACEGADPDDIDSHYDADDVVMPGAFAKSLREHGMPLLLRNHKTDAPIGTIVEAKEDKKGCGSKPSSQGRYVRCRPHRFNGMDLSEWVHRPADAGNFEEIIPQLKPPRSQGHVHRLPHQRSSLSRRTSSDLRASFWIWVAGSNPSLLSKACSTRWSGCARFAPPKGISSTLLAPRRQGKRRSCDPHTRPPDFVASFIHSGLCRRELRAVHGISYRGALAAR